MFKKKPFSKKPAEAESDTEQGCFSDLVAFNETTTQTNCCQDITDLSEFINKEYHQKQKQKPADDLMSSSDEAEYPFSQSKEKRKQKSKVALPQITSHKKQPPPPQAKKSPQQ